MTFKSYSSNTTTLALNTRPSCSTTRKMTNAYPSIEKKSPYNKRTPTPAQQHPKPHSVNKVDTYTSQPSDCSQPSSTNSHTKDPQHKKLQQWEDLKKREVHVSHSERQTAAQISTIISLKEKVKNLEQSNRCIKLEMATSQHETDGTRSRQLPPKRAEPPPPLVIMCTMYMSLDNLGNLQCQMQEYTTKIEQGNQRWQTSPAAPPGGLGHSPTFWHQSRISTTIRSRDMAK